MPFSGFYICPGCKPLAVGKISRGEAVGTIWRDGKRLVVICNGAFPDRCIHCNDAAHGFGVKRTYSWHHPSIYILIFLMPLLYIVVAIIVSKRFKAHVPLCERHRKRRAMGILICTAVLVAGLGCFFRGAAVLMSGDSNGNWIVYASIFVIFCDVIAAVRVTGLLLQMRVTKTHAFFRGAGAAFLESLPKWPGL